MSHPFGTILKATRLRFMWVESMQGFMRITDERNGFYVELRPNDFRTLDNGKGRMLLHRWCDTEEEIQELISLSPVLSNIKRIKKPFNLHLDEQGEIKVTRKSSIK